MDIKEFNLDATKYFMPLLDGACRSVEMLVEDAFDILDDEMPHDEVFPLVAGREFLSWWKGLDENQPYANIPERVVQVIQYIAKKRDRLYDKVVKHISICFTQEDLDKVNMEEVQAAVADLKKDLKENFQEFLKALLNMVPVKETNQKIREDLNQAIDAVGELFA